MNSTLLRFLAVMLALGAIAMAVIGYRLSTQPVPLAAPAPPSTYPQVVAARHVPAGQLLTAQDVRIDSLPQRDAEGYDSVGKVVGKLTLEPIAPGVPLRASHFPRLSQVAQALHPGERGVAIKVNEVIGVGGFVSPGDHVDVLLYLRADKETRDTSSAQVVLRNVRVLAFGEDVGATEDAQPSTLDRMTGASQDKSAAKADQNKKQDAKQGKASRSAILAVPEQDAARLMLAESSGQLRLALRGAEPPQLAAPNEDLSRYLRLADMAAPAAPRPLAVASTALPKRKSKQSPGSASTAKTSPVIVHRGDQVEIVRVRN